MNITEFREKYPQYEDMPDEQLAAAKSIVRTFGGVEVSSHGTDGIYISPQALFVKASGTLRVADNGGWGVNTSVQSAGQSVSGATYSGNVLGTYTADATSVNT